MLHRIDDMRIVRKLRMLRILRTIANVAMVATMGMQSVNVKCEVEAS